MDIHESQIKIKFLLKFSPVQTLGVFTLSTSC